MCCVVKISTSEYILYKLFSQYFRPFFQICGLNNEDLLRCSQCSHAFHRECLQPSQQNMIDHQTGIKHALKELDQFTSNTGYF